MKPILKWVENYLKNLPQRGGETRRERGCAIDLLDVYGTEGTKQALRATKTLTVPSKKFTYPPLKRRTKAEIEATLAFVREHHGW